MKLPRLITRRRVKWAGLGLGVSVLVLLIVSIWYTPTFSWSSSTRDTHVLLQHGQFRLVWYEGPARAMIPGAVFSFGRVFAANLDVRFLFKTEPNMGTPKTSVFVPLWFPLLLFAAPTACIWYTDRRAKRWQCQKCRYDLRGLEGGVCPECGALTGGASCPSMMQLLRITSAILAFFLLFYGLTVVVFAATDTMFPDVHMRMWLSGFSFLLAAACYLACLHFAFRPEGRCRSLAIAGGGASTILLLALAADIFANWNDVLVPMLLIVVASTTMVTIIIARPKAIAECHCPICGYDLTGLKPGAVCPECGKPIPGAPT